MAYLQMFGLTFIIIHTISIMFVAKLEIAKRIFLAIWMGMFVFFLPRMYQYLQASPLYFGGLCAGIFGIYTVSLFSQNIRDYIEHYKQIKKTRETRELFFVSETQVEESFIENPVYGSLLMEKTEAVEDDTQELSRLKSRQKDKKTSTKSSTDKVIQMPSKNVSQPAKKNMPSREEQAYDQPNRMSLEEEFLAVDKKENTDKVTPISYHSSTFEPQQTSIKEVDNMVSQTLSKLDNLFSGNMDKEESNNLFIEKESPVHLESSAEQPMDVTVTDEEEEILREIEIIFSQHKDQESPVTVHNKQAQDDVILTVNPLSGEAVEWVKTKKTEEPYFNTEEQIDKEIYFRFLLFEIRELLVLGFYQEAVDYLKEILIDSYDKEIRQNALCLLELIRVELYNPHISETIRNEYKFLEERKVL